MDMEKSLTNEDIFQELLELLKKNAMKEEANETFELCSYIEGLEKKIDDMTSELSNVQAQLKELQEDKIMYKIKMQLQESADKIRYRCDVMKAELIVIKDDIKSKATEIVNAVKSKGNVALGRINEIFKVKGKLQNLKNHVSASLREVDVTIAKINRFGEGIREANQKVANTFRTFADKEEVDYSKKEKKLTKTDLLRKPWEAKKKILELMDRRLECAIDKCKALEAQNEVRAMEKMWDRLYEQGMSVKEQNDDGLVTNVAERENEYGMIDKEDKTRGKSR